MPRFSVNSHKPNLIAGMILVMSLGVLYLSFEPVPAGETPNSAADSQFSSIEDFRVEDFEVPMPPEAAELPVVESVPDDSDVPDPVLAAAPSTLSNIELIEYSLFLLKDGAEFLGQLDTYTAVFHKQERLGGDLSEVQTIDVKIRQSQPFAVYMRWRNGDRGRQLLYSDEYDDGDMVVKLGGFKGRLLPGIKLNPKGSRALEKARHPVTQAGFQGMVDQMIAHRRRDLSRGHGMRCTRLPNQEFDQRDCFCFLYEYESPQISKEYRKSLILLDTKRHIPLMARNYTWAAEADDLSEDDLDALTLTENYAFTNVDFSKVLTAIEFSRKNPRYRM